ncbi:MAG TPA: hypothetical protein VIL48_01760 [Acidimicrobiales bacterium]
MIQDTGITRVQLVKLGLVAAFLAMCAAFVMENDARVETSLVLFSVKTQLWLGLVVALAVGALLGQAAGFLWQRRRRRRSAMD